MRLSGAWAVASPRALASSPQGKANLVGAGGKLFVLRGGGGWTTVGGRMAAFLRGRLLLGHRVPRLSERRRRGSCSSSARRRRVDNGAADGGPTGAPIHLSRSRSPA